MIKAGLISIVECGVIGMIPKIDLENMNWNKIELVVAEALLRRASLLNQPFMLKGSMVTRQYFQNPEERDIADMDWVYMDSIDHVEKANNLFTKWMIEITNMFLDDDVIFQDFNENIFWRRIDYAMSDDFPTVNTEIYYKVGKGYDYEDQLHVDISFNLDFDVKPIPLMYYPMYGEPFLVPYTPPLSLQVAWKLHQSIIRPRFKDLLDLKYLFQHPDYDNNAVQQTMKSLVNEWRRDNFVNRDRLKGLLYGDLGSVYEGIAEYDKSITKKQFDTFAKEFIEIMRKAGLTERLYMQLPI